MTPDWKPIENPPTEAGRYITRTPGDCWLVRGFDGATWEASEGNEAITHWDHLPPWLNQ